MEETQKPAAATGSGLFGAVKPSNGSSLFGGVKPAGGSLFGAAPAQPAKSIFGQGAAPAKPEVAKEEEKKPEQKMFSVASAGSFGGKDIS